MATKPLVDILVFALPLLYAGLVAVYGITFFRNAPRLEGFKRPYIIGVLMLHLVYLGLRTAAFDHPPITTVFAAAMPEIMPNRLEPVTAIFAAPPR